MKKVGVSILGLGTVGGGTYQILTKEREFYKETQHVEVSVESVLEPDEEKLRALGVPETCVAHNIAEVALDPDVHIVVECLDCADVAKEYVLDALKAGKTVVLSNRELYAKHAQELERAARRYNAGLFFEASCAGGVPVIRALLDGLQSSRICAISGLFGGAERELLTEMTEGRVCYEEALCRAKARGLSLASDAVGLDAAYQLSILASLAFHAKVPYAAVVREGVAGITPEDVAAGDVLGYVLRYVAVAKQSSAGVEARVHPAFVRKDGPLASVQCGCDAVLVQGDVVGEVLLSGMGTGALPVGSAVVSDILYAAAHGDLRDPSFKITAEAEPALPFTADFKSAYCLRLTVDDDPGALSKIAAAFGKNNISLAEVSVRPAEEAGKCTFLLVTHETHEEAVKGALKKLEGAGLAKAKSVLRVIG